MKGKGVCPPMFMTDWRLCSTPCINSINMRVVIVNTHIIHTYRSDVAKNPKWTKTLPAYLLYRPLFYRSEPENRRRPSDQKYCSLFCSKWNKTHFCRDRKMAEKRSNGQASHLYIWLWIFCRIWRQSYGILGGDKVVGFMHLLITIITTTKS